MLRTFKIETCDTLKFKKQNYFYKIKFAIHENDKNHEMETSF